MWSTTGKYPGSLTFSLLCVKLKALLGGITRKLKTLNCFQINCNGHQIKSPSSIAYLSIDIDQNVTDERTVNTILKRYIPV